MVNDMQTYLRPTLLAFIAATVSVGAPLPGLSLKIGNETAPPGGMAQMKVFVTEPKPISTGSSYVDMDTRFFGSVDGIALHSPKGDVAGAVTVAGSTYRINLASPLASFGTSLDYPVITITDRIRPNAPLGAQTTVTLANGSVLRDLFGVAYPYEVNSGQLTVAHGVSVTDVIPGSATVAAGGEVVIRGVNFTPDTEVRFAETKLRSVRFISAQEIRVTVESAARMHGMQVRVTNRDGSKDVYFAYQRTKEPVASSNPLLAATVPLFAEGLHSTATFVSPVANGRWFALAAQNITAKSVTVTMERVSLSGAVVGSRTFLVGPYERVARSAEEITTASGGQYWRVKSSAPVQSLGLVGDAVSRSVWPVAALLAQ